MKTLKNTVCLLTLTTILTGFLIGCDNDKTPLGKLKSDTHYPELADFWHKECKNKTKLWKQAMVYCKANKSKPNCVDVNFINELDTSSQGVTGILNASPIDSSF